jgi:hypothetical protein
MLSSSRLIGIAAAALVSWAAYTRLGALVGAGLLALLCGAVLVVLWVRAGRARRAVLNDPAISTLVFPPESKFQPSVLPPR